MSECKCEVSAAQQGCVHWARVPAAVQMFSVVSAQMTEMLHFLLSCLISSSSLLDSSSSHSPAERGSVGGRSRTEDDKETNCWTGQQKIPQKCLCTHRHMSAAVTITILHCIHSSVYKGASMSII